MALLDDVKTYLGPASSQYTDDALTAVIATETSAQAARCRVPDEVPADLAEALLRRVARNLAMRSLPLGVTDSSGDASSTYLPGSDPEIRRLEGPYRRLVVG